jgi:sigma-B regulation protein RsbU (phosphoserine phosphatase)
MQNELQNIGQLSNQVGEIIFGTIFLLVGLISAGIALIRRGKGFQILIWLAIWSGAYGIRLLLGPPAIKLLIPQYFQQYITFLRVAISYLILVFALLTWFELTGGIVRLYLKIMVYISLFIAIAGIILFVTSGDSNALMLYNNLITAMTLIMFIITISNKKFSEKHFLLPNRGVLAVGIIIFTSEALYSNLSGFFGYSTWPILGWLGFAGLIFSLAYVALKMIFTNERRLIEIENEMDTARQIQNSILPDGVPSLENLSIAASYYPMTAVAGDFYDFFEIDKHRTGFLIADVSGHGVPAALIASMIKVAMQSVSAYANNPGEVLRMLGNILCNQLHDQFVTASYLYLDTEKMTALYSAAGHPPILYWNSETEEIELIKSNGILLGILKDSDYPVRELSFKKNDRFLLYTDGLIETENSEGEAFGDRRLSEVFRENKNMTSDELNNYLLKELKLWQSSETEQQDDLTWILIDTK